MSRAIEYFHKFVSLLRIGFVGISGVALLILTFMITADTFFRFVFSAPFPASVEISQLIQPFVIFPPFAYALATNTHVRVTMVTQHFKGRFRKAVELFPFLVGFIFFSILTYVSWLNFWESVSINETMLAAVKLYWWIGKLAMPMGVAMITIECMYQFISVLKTHNYENKVVS